MSADRFAEVERLYHEAKNRPAHDRSAFLDHACGDNAVRREVESLLALKTGAGRFLSGSALEETVRASHQLWHAASWPTIPGYTVQRVLGEGGMGVVYLAEQETPFRRFVALKLIKPGMDTRQVVARFETERQALALMDHPNIAAVFDAGSTDKGRPYFVMEFVDGVPITEYCDTKRLSTRDRLALFVQVCAAVQHAHQKGVIHRDLKPSNVLVAARDGHPLPKVIDFGTAKAVGSAWSATATQDGLGMVLGTLEYMSPEQAALSADIDTATDVYSLGVLLYELLVGRLPFDTAELRAAGYDEIRRVIRESDPPKPSVRVEQRRDTSEPAARARQTNAPGLTKQLKGDLDWITLKALEKARPRRYQTVAAFASDIQRFLLDQPVDARPPSAGYRLRKFTRRHRGAVAATVSVFVVLVAGLAVSRWQYLRYDDARTEADRRNIEVASERARADSAQAAAENAIAEANLLKRDAEKRRKEPSHADGALNRPEYQEQAILGPAFSSADRNGVAPAVAPSPNAWVSEWLRDYAAGKHAEVAERLNTVASASRLQADLEIVSNNWLKAEPVDLRRRELAAFALEAGFALGAQGPMAGNLVEWGCRQVRRITKPGEFEQRWHQAALAALGGVFDPNGLHAHVVHVKFQFPDEPRLAFELALASELFAGEVLTRHNVLPADVAERSAEALKRYREAMAPPGGQSESWHLMGVARIRAMREVLR